MYSKQYTIYKTIIVPRVVHSTQQQITEHFQFEKCRKMWRKLQFIRIWFSDVNFFRGNRKTSTSDLNNIGVNSKQTSKGNIFGMAFLSQFVNNEKRFERKCDSNHTWYDWHIVFERHKILR